MQLNLGALNSSAKKRCVYFDTKSNSVNDQGILTNYNASTGVISCQTYHLTDFSIEEYDAVLSASPQMAANMNRVSVFHALNI